MPYVFGICGHGNVGILDALYDVRDKLKLISPRHEQCAGHMADAYFRVKHRPVATLTSTGPGLGQPGDVARHRAVGLVGLHGDHRQRADLAAQPRAVPGAVQAQPGRFPAGAAAGGQARVPADARRHAAAGAAPGLRHHGHRPPRPGEPRHSVQRVPGGGRRRGAAALARSVVRTARAPAMPTSPRRSTCWPRRTSRCCSSATARRCPRPAPRSRELAQRLGIPVITSPNGMGCVAGRRPAGAGLHRPQRRLSGQSGGPLRRPGDHAGHPLRRSLLVELAPGLFVELSEDASCCTSTSTRRSSAATTRRRWASSPTPRRSCASCCNALSSRTGAIAPARYAPWREQVRRLAARVGGLRAPALRRLHQPAAPRVRGRHAAEAAARRRDPRARLAACTTTGSCSSGRRGGRRACSTAGATRRMGFGVCGILGAQLAAPDRPCVAVVGDGGFTMAPHVLCTAVEYDLPVVWVIWNNFAWAAIRDMQYGMFDGREIGTAFYKGGSGERYNPDFAAWARACGADGVTVTRVAGPRRRGRAGAEEPPPLRDRRARRRRGAAALDRHLAAAADSVQGADLRQAARGLTRSATEPSWHNVLWLWCSVARAASAPPASRRCCATASTSPTRPQR